MKSLHNVCFSVLLFSLLHFLANKAAVDAAPLHAPRVEIKVDDMNKATCLGWTVVNQHLMAGFDDGTVIKYDPVVGKEVQRTRFHTDRVNTLNFNSDKTLLITASKDTTAKLVDPQTLEVVKVYQTERPVNAAVISPLHPHVLLGGGQDAMTVTVTSASQGKFETRFFHMIYEEEFGRVKGHFGPINAISIHPRGTAYASGAEDGYVSSLYHCLKVVNNHIYSHHDCFLCLLFTGISVCINSTAPT